MASPFLLALLSLLVGLAIGAVATVLAGRASRASERQAGAALAQQAEMRAAEHNARVEELAALRAEHAAVAQQRENLRGMVEELRVTHARIEAEHASLRARQAPLEVSHAQALEEHRTLRQDLGAAREALQAATTQLAAEREAGEQRLRAERVSADEKLALLSEARVALSHQFETLAARIFDEKAKRFGEQNQAGMESLLAPLREKLGEFQSRVEGLQQEGVVGRTELRTHIETLSKLNDRLSAEASSLASALKGSSKTQGDWGEVLLERMLEDAGLRRDQEYRVQESFTRDDGTRARPDVIIDLPGGKHLVVDAKVSLSDYNAYCECTDEANRALSLGKHVQSLRAHIRGLKKRDYQVLYQLQSIDFVVMFVPIEPAYLLALSKDGRLWQEAWENDVLLVSPGTLFPVIRTVAHLWRQEQQNRNVQAIVDRGAELYDKLAGFAGDLVKVGDGLDAARGFYDKAMNKLRTGKGNAIRQAELLKALGVKPSKQMPKELLEVLEEELVRTLVDEAQPASSTTSLFTGPQ